MIKKFFIKLMNWSEQRENFSASSFRTNQADQAKLARERHEQIMAGRNKKYVSEQTIPTEENLLGPSDSEASKEEGQ